MEILDHITWALLSLTGCVLCYWKGRRDVIKEIYDRTQILDEKRKRITSRRKRVTRRNP